jgi:hypothetical protein
MKIETKSPLRSEARSGPSNLTIPARIIIGVAGPQKIEAKPGLIDAIRTHRDYMRNSRLSAGMVRYLEEMKVQIDKATDHEDFLSLVKEIEETMQHENQEWRVEIHFHRPAVPR